MIARGSAFDLAGQSVDNFVRGLQLVAYRQVLKLELREQRKLEVRLMLTFN